MTQRIELERWGVKDGGKVGLAIVRTELHHWYYRCFSVEDK
jgi:hypothetical protein